MDRSPATLRKTTGLSVQQLRERVRWCCDLLAAAQKGRETERAEYAKRELKLEQRADAFLGALMSQLGMDSGDAEAYEAVRLRIGALVAARAAEKGG